MVQRKIKKTFGKKRDLDSLNKRENKREFYDVVGRVAFGELDKQIKFK